MKKSLLLKSKIKKIAITSTKMIKIIICDISEAQVVSGDEVDGLHTEVTHLAIERYVVQG
jgi:hypothetical protein